MLTILLFIAILIVGVLAAIAMHMQNKVKRMEQAKDEQQQFLDEQKQEQRANWNKSIQVLAQGLLEEQVTATEVAIRIGVLLEYLDVDATTKDEYSAFYQLAEATAYIPILEKWNELSTKEKLRYDSERVAIESNFNDFVKDAATRIKGQFF